MVKRRPTVSPDFSWFPSELCLSTLLVEIDDNTAISLHVYCFLEYGVSSLLLLFKVLTRKMTTGLVISLQLFKILCILTRAHQKDVLRFTRHCILTRAHQRDDNPVSCFNRRLRARKKDGDKGLYPYVSPTHRVFCGTLVFHRTWPYSVAGGISILQ